MRGIPVVIIDARLDAASSQWRISPACRLSAWTERRAYLAVRALKRRGLKLPTTAAILREAFS